MHEHRFFYYPYAYFTNVQLPLLNVVALDIDKLYIFNLAWASWNTFNADHFIQDQVK